MKTCNDCIHFAVCDNFFKDEGTPLCVKEDDFDAEAGCSTFCDKSNIFNIVRCKDCKYGTYNKLTACIFCWNDSKFYPLDNFCMEGKKK